ncbi:MAG: hypothetical protein KDA42_09175 [Planctomycetales bacterium]|nr:hypothetical protein [Planctomycetales bacterium]
MARSACSRIAASLSLVSALGGMADVGTLVAHADSVRAAFDVGPLVACRDVTTAEFAEAFPGQKTVEATCYVSVRIVEGDARQLDEIAVEIRSPQGRARVVDFAPQTTLESETVGPIEITTTKETTRALGANAAGSASLPTLIIPNQFSPSANLGTNKRDVVVEKRSQPSPHQVTVASGTMDQEHGVFFALRRSANFSLEGRHEFMLRLSVPHAWRGDWLRLSCSAHRDSSGSFFKSDDTCGAAQRFVALFAVGDDEAYRAARRVVVYQGRDEADREPTGVSVLDELLAAPKASVEFSRLALTYPLRWARKSQRDLPKTAAVTEPQAKDDPFAVLLADLAEFAAVERPEPDATARAE